MNSPNRGYNSPIRDERANDTRRRILDSAYRLFLDEGYPATTVAAIARDASVSAQTVYNTFGSKPALLKAVYDVQLAGDDEPIAMRDRPEFQALYATTDPAEFLMTYARVGRMLMDRVGPFVLALLAGAGAGDADLAAHIETIDGERLRGTQMAAARLAELGGLDSGISADRARDALWTLNSAQVWQLLVQVRGWSGDEYEQWIGRAMCGAVGLG